MARDREHILVWLVQAKFRLLQDKNYFVMLKLNVTKMCQIYLNNKLSIVEFCLRIMGAPSTQVLAQPSKQQSP